jgi:hypothetical protein
VSTISPADFPLLITGHINCRDRPDTDQIPTTSVSYLDGVNRAPVHVNGMPVIEANLWQSVCQPLTRP